MDLEGPQLEVLLRRISEIPADLTPSPEGVNRSAVAVPAIIYDVAASFGIMLTADELAAFEVAPKEEKETRRALMLILCWLISDPWFLGALLTKKALTELLHDVVAELTRFGSAAKYVNDPDRREELSRLVLLHFGYRPAGETKAQAQDRLTTLSMVERNRVMRASRQAEERARAIRAALVKKAADEAADKWTRE